MTTLDDVAKKKQVEQSAEQQAAVELVRLAQEQDPSLTGPDGLLKQLTKTVLEAALNEEMTEHLGYEKHAPAACVTEKAPTPVQLSVAVHIEIGRPMAFPQRVFRP